MGLSRWRRASREVIEQTLSALPIGADYKTKRKALWEAYPFGVKALHPYRVWCEECRRAIGDPPRPEAPAPVVSVSPSGVLCGWCPGKLGCLACYAARRQFERERGPEGTTDWRKWEKWCHLIAQGPPDPVLLCAFADWLEEQGWPEQAAIERRQVSREEMCS